MKKRIVSVLLASVLTVSCLAGCGNSGSESTPSDTTPAADTTENTEGEGSTESVGAQITVDESATDNVAVEGDFSGADLTVFMHRIMRKQYTSP